MMDEYITRNNAISAVCFGCNQQFSDEPCEPSECTIRQSIMALPTANVVPKSEYDAIVSAVDNSTQEFLKLHDDYQEAKREVERWRRNLEAVLEEIPETKREVAREIFEEIENSSSIIIAGIRHYVICEYELAELKKKYAEVEHEP